MEFKRNNSDRNSDCFIRRLSMCDNFFCKPLIVYKISSKDSLENTKQAIKILITKKQICNIFIENDYFNEFLDILNNEQYKEVANKLLKYNKLTSTPDLCIVIGGDGTVLWSHSLFGINNRPPFLTFNMGTLGYLAYYNCKLMQEIFIQVFDHPKNELIMEKRSTLMFHKILKDDVVKKETDKKTLLLDSSNVVEGIALNDLVINRESQRAIILDIFLNCTFFTTH